MPAFGQWMADGQHAHKLVLEQDVVAQAAIVDIAAADRDIHLAVDHRLEQRIGETVIKDLEIEASALAAEIGHEAGQPPVAGIGAATQPHYWTKAFAEERKIALDPIDFTGNGLGCLQQLFAAGRQMQALADAMEDVDRDTPLGLLDV